MSAGTPAPRDGGGKTIATNRKASFDFHLLEKIEAGLELRGPEVKAIRDGLVSLNESFARIDGEQVFIYGMHVQPYKHSPVESHDPIRVRRLLLHRSEIGRLIGQVNEKGKTLVPVRLYLKHGLIKLEIALGKGKQTVDKRETIKRRTTDRETARTVAAMQKGRKG
ncbi:MAG TPA: SsrA-binding protein SmpB [Kiritimatiellia bacterium]|nr:SsrA-binding protein SmpB [Kiritimatiellia bacterium]HMP33734.1 SsrA-binding protein SmpB [Kiritimatiellia bacterium]